MSQEIAVLTEKIKQVESKMLQLLPADVVKREISFAVQHVAASTQLQKCTPLSLQTAVYNIANIGLSLNPASKEAYLVPRYNSQIQGMEASLQPSYVGLVKLLTDAGTVIQVVSNIVFEGDKFSIDLVSGQVQHQPCLLKANKGNKIGCYAVATLPNGSKQAEWMECEDIDKIRDCSESWKNEKTRAYSPWLKYYDEMARKTLIRRLYKYLPRSGRNTAKIDEAILVDDAQYQASMNQLMYIEDLLRTANITPEKEALIHSEFQKYSYSEAQMCIDFLLENQVESNDPAKQFTSRSKS